MVSCLYEDHHSTILALSKYHYKTVPKSSHQDGWSGAEKEAELFTDSPTPAWTWIWMLDSTCEPLMQLYSTHQRQRLNLGLRWKQQLLLKHLRKAKKEVPPMEKPKMVKTHLGDMITQHGRCVPDLWPGGKLEMIGHYLGESSITYKPEKHYSLGANTTPVSFLSSSSGQWRLMFSRGVWGEVWGGSRNKISIVLGIHHLQCPRTVYKQDAEGGPRGEQGRRGLCHPGSHQSDCLASPAFQHLQRSLRHIPIE